MVEWGGGDVGRVVHRKKCESIVTYRVQHLARGGGVCYIAQAFVTGGGGEGDILSTAKQG